MEFICGKAEDVLPDILDRKLKWSDSLVAVVDPPRAGLHKRVIEVSGFQLLNFALSYDDMRGVKEACEGVRRITEWTHVCLCDKNATSLLFAILRQFENAMPSSVSSTSRVILSWPKTISAIWLGHQRTRDTKATHSCPKRLWPSICSLR